MSLFNVILQQLGEHYLAKLTSCKLSDKTGWYNLTGSQKFLYPQFPQGEAWDQCSELVLQIPTWEVPDDLGVVPRVGDSSSQGIPGLTISWWTYLKQVCSRVRVHLWE